MGYQQTVQMIVDGMIIVMAALLILITLALIILHFLINSKQKGMERIKQRVLRRISVNEQIEYLRNEIYQAVNAEEPQASLQGIWGIRSNRGLQVLEMVSRELEGRQAEVLCRLVSSEWYGEYLRKKLSGRGQDAALLATKLIGQLHVSNYTFQIERNFNRWPKDAMVQEIGLLTMFQLGEKERIIWLLSKSELAIILSFRTLHELFRSYCGDYKEFYQELLPVAKDQYVKRACIRGIGECGCRELCEMIAPELSAHQINVQLEAIRSLGKLGYTPVAEQIRALTAHSAWEIRCAAVDALAVLDSEGCYKAILQCLCDPVWWVRFHAAEALALLPCRERLLEDVGKSGDRYAWEMLQYIIERNLILMGGVA